MVTWWLDLRLSASQSGSSSWLLDGSCVCVGGGCEMEVSFLEKLVCSVRLWSQWFVTHLAVGVCVWIEPCEIWRVVVERAAHECLFA